MECPHCQQELPALTCESCGQKALEGAGFCHHCGHQLTGGEEPKLLTCSSCGADIKAGFKYCPQCGEEQGIGAGAESLGGFDPDERVACSDGMCIGIIGADGKCTECGKPFGGPAEAEEA